MGDLTQEPVAPGDPGGLPPSPTLEAWGLRTLSCAEAPGLSHLQGTLLSPSPRHCPPRLPLGWRGRWAHLPNMQKRREGSFLSGKHGQEGSPCFLSWPKRVYRLGRLTWRACGGWEQDLFQSTGILSTPKAETNGPGRRETEPGLWWGRQAAPRPGTRGFHHFSQFIPRWIMGGTQGIHPPVHCSKTGEGKKDGLKGWGHFLQRRPGLPPHQALLRSDSWPPTKYTPKQGGPCPPLPPGALCKASFVCSVSLVLMQHFTFNVP